MSAIRAIGVFIACTCAHAFAQTGPTIVGIGYPPPPPHIYMTITAGQILTLQVAGLSTVLPIGTVINAAATPLPTNLSVFSVVLTENTAIAGELSFPMPMLSVSQVDPCGDPSDPTPDCAITYITVQIPFEVVPPWGGSSTGAILTVFENGQPSKGFLADLVSINVHIVTTCGYFAGTYPSPCSSVVTHADGTAVTMSSPAKPGETVVIYAWGLGKTLTPVNSGEPTPLPPDGDVDGLQAQNGVIGVQFDFAPNAGASQVIPKVRDPAILYAGLTPGQIGLYQINVRLPAQFPGVRACDGVFVLSNLTISVGGAPINYTPPVMSSYDGAAICVQPQPADRRNPDDKTVTPSRGGKP